MSGLYRHREEAGRRLAEALAGVRASVVVGIPRGGVVVAQAVALHGDLPLSVVFARKLAVRDSPELAFGAMDEDGRTLLDPATVRELSLDPCEIEDVTCHVAAGIRRRQSAYHALPLDPALLSGGAILVDDGFATGLTARCAVQLLRRRGAPFVVVAAPCASALAVRELRRVADDVVCPVVSDSFYAVSAYYRNFDPVPDEAVVELLSGGGPLSLAPGRPRGFGEPIGRGR